MRNFVVILHKVRLLTALMLLSCVAVVVIIIVNTSTNHGRLRQRQQETTTTTTDVVPFQQQQQQHYFPTLKETHEMAALSSLVYKFHHAEFYNFTSEHICELVNSRNVTDRPVPTGVQCHWYYHDWEGCGVQVMIVSSEIHNYVAVVFAGTDDLRTSLTDADIFMTEFGTASAPSGSSSTSSKYNVTLLPDHPDVRVHAGFNHAVFGGTVFDEIVDRVEAIRQPQHRMLTTGHSLGASNAVLTAVGLSVYYNQTTQLQQQPLHIVSINFGCPKIGNAAWRDFLHSTDSNNAVSRKIAIWRFVLGWDLVPRLPELFVHAGHTIQLSYNKSSSNYYKNKNQTATAEAYYHHYGNASLQYAGVPFGWSAKPFIWVPSALLSHAVSRYYKFFDNYWWQSSSQEFVHDFVHIPDVVPDDDDDHPPNVDDDFWVDPPDDDFVAADAEFSTS